MKIQKLQINGFGNLQNKNLELQDHINIIYGKNESGKSTLLKCITNIFYGTSKNKKGRDISDYDKFLPWKGEDFSAKLSYKLDDGRKYEVYREFGKRNPKIYDEEAKDISALFTQDKTKGNQFFYEQTGVEEETFLSSLAVMQKEVKLEEGQQNTIIQKVANLVSTGNEGVSFKRCINQLNKRQLEEVGTARSQDRPINILEEELENLEIEKSSLELIKKEKYEIEDKKKALEKIIDGQRNKVDILDKLKQSKEQEKIEQEKIQMNLEIIKRNDEQIEKLQKEKEDLERKQKIEEKGNKKRKNSNKKYLVISILLLILSIVALVIIPNLVIKQVMGAFGVASSLIFLIIFFIKKQKCVKAERKRKKKKQKI